MSMPHTHASPPLRLWPGAIAAVLLVLLRFVVPAVMVVNGALVGLFGAIVCAALILVWWLFFSRAPWLERLGAIAFGALALTATSYVVHESISNGLMRRMLPVFAVPILCLALVVAVVATRRRTAGARRLSIAVALLVACGAFTLIRTDGITGEAESDIHWRWTPTPEERLLAQAGSEAIAAPPAAAAAPAASASAPVSAPPSASAPAPIVERSPKPGEPTAAGSGATPATAPVVEKTAAPADPDATRPAEWPGFRGRERNGVVRGTNIETDWSAKPPQEMWRRPVGPGWSSFAVRGSFVYTQEQRGEEEIVAAYDLNTGKPIWRHRDPVRFWESNAGAGPRGTPTIDGARVYALGATGVLNALDARTGAKIWSRNAATDTGKKVPDWGIASSPLVVGDIVVVAAAGMLSAYDASTGKPRWLGPKGGSGYSSPHVATIGGVTQIVLMSVAGATSVSPADGTVLWSHEWRGDGVVQPALLAGNDILLGSGSGLFPAVGVRRLGIEKNAAGWSVQERWTSHWLKPYFNDFVVHEGHAYGVDGSILACIDLETGARKWKGGRFGHGQVILLADQDLLLVLSEEGELALVKAAPDQFTEVARAPALEGKTWNHPVLAGDVLLVRNDREMAAFRLARR
jgi:outer membrane protein assembly factor BamB